MQNFKVGRECPVSGEKIMRIWDCPELNGSDFYKWRTESNSFWISGESMKSVFTEEEKERILKHSLSGFMFSKRDLEKCKQ